MFLSIDIHRERADGLVIFGPQSQKLYFGRTSEAPDAPIIRLLDRLISKLHTCLERVDEEQILLRDLGGTSRTILDDRVIPRLEARPLTGPTHVVILGRWSLRIRCHRWSLPGTPQPAGAPPPLDWAMQRDPFFGSGAQRDEERMGELRAMLHNPERTSFETILHTVQAMLPTQPGALEYALAFARQNNFAGGPLRLFLEHFTPDTDRRFTRLPSLNPLAAILDLLVEHDQTPPLHSLDQATLSLLEALAADQLDPTETDRQLSCALLAQLGSTA